MELFTPVAIEDIPLARERKCKSNEIIAEFLNSGLDIAEFHWKEATRYSSVTAFRNSIRAVISRKHIPIRIIVRGDQVFFVRKGGN